jgi:hypothetical protein
MLIKFGVEAVLIIEPVIIFNTAINILASKIIKRTFWTLLKLFSNKKAPPKFIENQGYFYILGNTNLLYFTIYITT